jgi:UDP-N-acetyl-alpha-D-muramoyl-L-alanyl-L-glutamate epimerase
MPNNNKGEKFHNLRAEFPFFAFDGFDYQYSDKGLRAQFHFSLSDKYVFHPTLTIPAKEFFIPGNINDDFIQNVLFQIGMVESISYWKAACPEKFIVRGYTLTPEQINWWKKLFYNGLGEFLFLNEIDVSLQDFIEIECEPEHSFKPFTLELGKAAIIPVGGGKDSVVTLELLGYENGNKALILNPREASRGTVMKMGLYYDSIVEVQRSIDPVLLELNAKGFLNGHTPFSALLAFISVLAAGLCGNKYIALSNESSANESTVKGSEINHQYSKSFEFEEDMRFYVRNFISPEIEYFSFLRPLNELQIARLFSVYPNYFDVFKSCNVGSKTDSWCGNCAKCLFTYIILSPFIPQETLETVFGKNLLKDINLWPLLRQLTGMTSSKPFDCIGTLDEVNAALHLTINGLPESSLPELLQLYKDSEIYFRYLDFDSGSLLTTFNKNHFLPEEYEKLLRAKIHA